MIDRPIFLLSSPRSGSTLLFETMRQAPHLYSTGGESHGLIETVPGLHPSARGWHSNRLDAAAATPETTTELVRRFTNNLRDRDGRPPATSARMIEKTPKNSLRVPFFQAIFPDARYVFLYRDWRQTLASMIEAWVSRRFITYPRLPDWPSPSWSLVLAPGWEQWRGLPLPEIVARQWSVTLDMMFDDLEALAPGSVVALDYAQLVEVPDATMRALCAAVGLGWDRTLEGGLPLSPSTISTPAADKWRRYERDIMAVEPLVARTDMRARAFLGRHAIGA